MAKILMTAIVADIRNKLNGSVFSKNRYGAYVRTKVTPVNPASTAQQNARNILSTWSQGWRGLTPAQRSAWISNASNFPFTDIFGNVKILSGNTLYVKLNSNLNYAGAAGIDDVPTPADIPAITALSLAADASASTLAITFAPTPVPADFAIIVQATGNIPPGITFVKNRFRNIAVIDAAGTSPYAAGAEWETIHGDLVAGMQVFVKIFMVSKLTGQAGIPIQAVTTVVP